MSPNPLLALSMEDAKISVLLAVAWGVREIASAYARRVQRGEAEATRRGYEGMQRVLDTLEGARRSAGASRAMFLVARNNGGVPKPGCEVKVSIRYEVASDSTRLIHAQWQDWLADGPYLKLLTDIASDKGSGVMLSTEHLKPGSLRNLYESDDHVGSIVPLVGHVCEGHWMAYLSFNFRARDEAGGTGVEVAPDGTIEPTVMQREIVVGAARTIRHILSEYHNVMPTETFK